MALDQAARLVRASRNRPGSALGRAMHEDGRLDCYDVIALELRLCKTPLSDRTWSPTGSPGIVTESPARVHAKQRGRLGGLQDRPTALTGGSWARTLGHQIRQYRIGVNMRRSYAVGAAVLALSGGLLVAVGSNAPASALNLIFDEAPVRIGEPLPADPVPDLTAEQLAAADGIFKLDPFIAGLGRLSPLQVTQQGPWTDKTGLLVTGVVREVTLERPVDVSMRTWPSYRFEKDGSYRLEPVQKAVSSAQVFVVNIDLRRAQVVAVEPVNDNAKTTLGPDTPTYPSSGDN